MNSRIVIVALVAMLAAAAAPAFIGGDARPREAASALGDDPRVGLCEPRCGPRPDRQTP